mgnify:CR=1 FL=1
MPIYTELNKGKVPVKIYTDEIEYDAISQLINVSQLPFIHSHIAAMPDVHCGKGATIGSIIPTKGAIIPAAVGVDIGCGMQAVRLGIKRRDLPKDLGKLRKSIEKLVPIGFTMNEPANAHKRACKELDDRLDAILKKHPELMKMVKNLPQTWVCQMGTLGGGNHFIEICYDQDDHVWVMLHTGSRGLGNAMGRYFMSLAKNNMPKDVRLPSKDLAYFSEGTQLFNDYVETVTWAQDYARTNRDVIMREVLSVVDKSFSYHQSKHSIIDCHHNYVTVEEHFGEKIFVTRKGAIRAENGDIGIIPGSMGAKSFIVEGLGNAESFNSCSHGAGRKMSRSKAKRSFTRKDLEPQTKGIECRKDKEVLDEIPSAYKNIDSVMEKQTDLVKVLHTLKQVVCIKG